MKRYIKSSQLASRYHIKNWHNLHQDYIVYVYDIDNPETMSLQLSEIHPYDDAHYAYARFENSKAKYIKDSKILEEQIFEYDAENYENEDEYIDDVIDTMILALRKLNKDVQPRVMHF